MVVQGHLLRAGADIGASPVLSRRSAILKYGPCAPVLQPSKCVRTAPKLLFPPRAVERCDFAATGDTVCRAPNVTGGVPHPGFVRVHSASTAFCRQSGLRGNCTGISSGLAGGVIQQRRGPPVKRCNKTSLEASVGSTSCHQGGCQLHACACRLHSSTRMREGSSMLPCPRNTAAQRRSLGMQGATRSRQCGRGQGSFSPSRAISTAPSRVFVPPMKPAPPQHL